MPDVDLIAAEPGRLETARRQGDHLGVRDRSGCPDQLGPDLVGLPSLLETALIGGENRARVAQPQGERGGAQLARDQARHGHCALTHQCDDLAARITELEEAAALLRSQAQLQHLEALDHRGDDVAVAPPAHLLEQRFLRRSQRFRLLRQEVAKTRHAAESHSRLGTTVRRHWGPRHIRGIGGRSQGKGGAARSASLDA